MNLSVPVAINGIGCICAAGLNLRECMNSLFSGTRQPTPPERFTYSHPISYPVFEVFKDFCPDEADERVELTRTNSLALAAAQEALNDAGWNRETLDEKRVGVCVGTTVGCTMNNEDFYREYRKGLHPDMAPIKLFLSSNPAAAIAREWGFTGPCQTVVNACSSGTDAVGLGAFWIRSGICDVVVAGGADELCRTTYNGFISLMITDDSPCKPFDRDRKGLNLGEGAAMLLLESDDAVRGKEKRARSYVLGYGTACDAYHLTAPRPDGKGLKQAITDALADSGRTVEEISFVNAHGTGTRDNDRIECQALNEMLPGVPFFSTKGYTGHTLGAAGAIEAAFTVACIEEHMIPVNTGFNYQDPELPASPVVNTMEISRNIAITESLAFGGHNAVLILGNERD